MLRACCGVDLLCKNIASLRHSRHLLRNNIVVSHACNNIGCCALLPLQDCQVVVEGHKSGFSPPGDLEFQEWGKQALKKSTHANLFASKAPKSEPKEDFSHLPPAQQKKKLKAKIQELESAIHKSTSDKCVLFEGCHVLFGYSLLRTLINTHFLCLPNSFISAHIQLEYNIQMKLNTQFSSTVVFRMNSGRSEWIHSVAQTSL